MPLYPFFILAVVFLAVLLLPPFIAAYLDHRRELRREAHGTASNDDQDASSAVRRRDA